MNIALGNFQHIGGRASQQDAFGFSDKDDRGFVAHGGVLALVADGMGGMANGGEASHLAVGAFLKRYMAKSPGEPIPDALQGALQQANDQVYQFALQAGQVEKTGTTLVAAVAHGNSLYWISVGDSRLYLYRNGGLTLITEDHLYADELDRDAAAGRITVEAAKNHPERSALTSFLGQERPEAIDCNTTPLALKDGDRLLLCSDGLYAALTEEEMVQVMEGNPQRAAEKLADLVLTKQRSGQDNLTLALLACEEWQKTLCRYPTPEVLKARRKKPVRGKKWRRAMGMALALTLACALGARGYWWFLGRGPLPAAQEPQAQADHEAKAPPPPAGEKKEDAPQPVPEKGEKGQDQSASIPAKQPPSPKKARNGASPATVGGK